jgi:Flp pilus assembly protein TadD
MKILRKLTEIVLATAILIAIVNTASAQGNASEQDIIKKAAGFFGNEKFVEALPLYAQLVSVHADNAEYNFCYGVSALFANRKDKDQALRFLTKAANLNSKETDLNYYLALAYYQKGDYSSGLKYFTTYLSSSRVNEKLRQKALDAVNACLNGMNLQNEKLFSSISEGNEFSYDNFSRGYPVTEISGDLILKPDIFQTELDKQKQEHTYVFLTEPRGIVYFAGYGDNEATGRDIYTTVINSDGNWSAPTKLGSSINTSFDEDFPVMTNNGNTLYFSSKGHNTLGGYDIFRSDYNMAEHRWNEPVNLGADINSPFDDMLYIADKNNTIAYFASNRMSDEGTIMVFQGTLKQSGNVGQEIETPIAVTENKPNVATTSVVLAKNEVVNKDQSQANVPGNSEAYQHRQQMLADRADARKLTDSTFLYVSNTKDYIRDLTNKRNRLRNIANTENINVDELKKEFNAILRKVDGMQDKNKVKAELAIAVDMKKGIYQHEATSRQAEFVANKLDEQIRIKTRELEKLKESASEMQLYSANGDLPSSKNYFSNVKEAFISADTLTDFSSEIVALAANDIQYVVPESELAFADEILKQKQSDGLVAQQTKIAPAPVIKQTQEIAYNDNGKTEMADEKLEINSVVDIVVQKPVKEIQYNELAYSDTEIADEKLEINSGVDVVFAKQVKEIQYNELAYSDTGISDENLEINSGVDAVVPKQVEEVFYNDLAYFDGGVGEENLELDFAIDSKSASNKTSEALKKLDAENSKSQQHLAVNTTVTGNSNTAPKPASKPKTYKKYKSSFDGVALLRGKSLYFKSMVIASNEIETSLTDEKLLRAAIVNPDVLSYDELLYAANITQNKTNALAILETASLRTDRDWRAFNNAAIISMNMIDFEKAEELMDQAVELSAHNGKIENNKGILAFYLGDFQEAEACFNLANSYGEHTSQNIQVLHAARNIYDSGAATKSNYSSENPTELMGDIIEYFPTNK